MTQRELRELEFSKKKYDVIEDMDMREKVTELEHILSQPLDLWTDIDQYEKFQKINTLNLSDKRLLLVYSILGGSVARTATHFKVSRRTISDNILRIKNLLGLDND